MRALLAIFASASGYLIILQVTHNNILAYIGILSGLLIAVSAILFEERVKRTPLSIVAGGAVGLILGLVVANLLTYPLVINFFRDNLYLQLATYLFTNCIIGYIGLSIGMKKGDELGSHFGLGNTTQAQGGTSQKTAGTTPTTERRAGLIIDTSVIIDGRIAEVVETGFVDGIITVPQFVLGELQHIADSSDQMKRVRGKRGLEVLKQVQASERVTVVITDRDFPEIREVDAKLVALARDTGARILTNDSNLHKVAELQGVGVLNMNMLATAMKPVVMPGELLVITVVKEGKEQNQGVGYLEDGTMVVIDNARAYLGKTIEVTITSVLQTSGGRMVFSKPREEVRQAASTA